jgi:hypothetical protein
MARDRASVIVALAQARDEFAGGTLLAIAHDCDAYPQERREIGSRIGAAIGAASVHLGLKFTKQRIYVTIIEDEHIIHRRQRRDQSRATALGEDGTALALQLPRACIGVKRHNEQIAFGARCAQVADVTGVKQIKHAISEDDPATRAAVFLKHFVQTATRKNFIACIHQELSIAG